MGNNKEFNENYEHNSEIILKLIEKKKSKMNRINKKNETAEKTKNAFAEVYEIINHLEKKSYNRIPKNLISLIEKNMNSKYKPSIDYTKNINEQNLMKETRVILSLIYRDYLCSSETRRELKQNDIIELNKFNEENAIDFNYEEIFKKKEEYVDIPTKNNAITTYKENIFKRIIDFLKRKFARYT